MENNTEAPKGKRKNLLLYILFTLLVFAPTVLIIVILLVQGVDGADLAGGTESGAPSAPPGLAEPDVSGYLALVEEGVPISELPDGYSEMRRVTVAEEAGLYTFYFTADGKKAYYTLNDTSAYAVGATSLDAFMSSDASLDVRVPRPVLYHDGEAVIPLSEEFLYVNESGERVALSRLFTDSTESTSAGNGRIYLCFDTQPDECTVTLYDGEKRVFTGLPQDLIKESFEEYDALYCHVYARWRERVGAAFGYANYGFAVRFTDLKGDAATESDASVIECGLDTEEICAGEYAILTVKGVESCEGILISASPSLPYDIEPFLFDGGAFALIPVPSDMPACEISLCVTVGETELYTSLCVTERAYKEREYDASDILISLSRNEAALLEYERIRSVINGIPTGEVVSQGHLSERVGAVLSDQSIYLGFGYYRRLRDGTRYPMEGVDYRLAQGTDIPAILSGTVLYSGYSCYLGNFVVLDHGAGVRTWYTHLSTACVLEGDGVSSGDTIGKAGRSGFTTTQGVYVMCEINGVSVSPYPVIEGGIFKKQG